MENISKTFEKYMCNICIYKNKQKCKQIIKQQKNKVKIYKCLNFHKRKEND